MNDFDTYFSESVARRRQAETRRVSTGLTLHDTPPDAVARARETGQMLGAPTGVVEAAPEMFQRQVDQQRATQLLTSAPLTTMWIQDFERQRLARDDLENLTWFEHNLGPGGRAIGRGTRRLSAFPDHFAATAAGTRAADVGKTYDDILAEEWGRFKVEDLEAQSAPGWRIATAMTNARDVARLRYAAIEGQGEPERLEYIRYGAERLASAGEIMRIVQNIPMSDTAIQFRDGTLATGENTFQGKLGAFVIDPIGGAAFIAETLAETLPVLAGATATTLVTRSPGAGVGVMASGSFVVENTSAALGFLQERGIDIATPEAAALVLQNRELMAEAQDFGTKRGLIIALFDALSGGIAGQALAKNPVGDIVLHGIIQAAFGGGGEATAQLATGQDLDWGDIVVEGLADLAAAPIVVVGVGGRGLLDRTARLGRSGETATTIEAVDEQAASSRLRDRDPEMFGDALEAQGLGDLALLIPADALREYFQGKDGGFDPGRIEAWGLDPQAFEDAALAGTDVSIPLSTYAAKISGTEDAAWVRDHAVLTPDEMSVAEAEAFNTQMRDTLSEEIETAVQARQEDVEARTADIEIYDQMFAQLRAAGRAPGVAQNEASVWAAFWRTMGERYGANPRDLANAMGVEVRGPQALQMRRDQLDTALDTLRSQESTNPENVSLAEFVGSKGGLRHEDGVTTDLPQDVIASEDGQGVSLAEMAQMAFDAGYFTALPTADALVQAIQDDGTQVDGKVLQELSDALEARRLDLSLSNDEIAAALNETDGTTLEQPGKRGSIQLPNGGLREGQSVINLFEGANLSTFLHESGHFFLEAFGELAAHENAPQAMKDDLGAIHKWLGVTDAAGIETQHHEKWARGFEAYLLEGKAPSLALGDAFARFKAWLLRIYRTARALDVKITKDIREVMDRMLATEAEIAEARAEVAMRPLFADAPAGMSESEFAAYRRLALRASEGAEQALLEKTMARVQREKETWYKQEKKAVAAEVTAEINRQPRYRLIDMLANQRWHEEDGGVREVADMRIDRGILVEQFGDGVLADISRTRFGGARAVYGPNGATPQEVAEFFGFQSALEMIDALKATPKKRDAIATEVEARMVARYGDPLNDGSIEAEALTAIHSEHQMTLSVSEARHLATELGRSTRTMTTRLYRQRARDMIGRMTVRDAVRAERFLAAERKAARAAQAAFAKVTKGKGEAALAEALQAKEQQILNGFLYNEARQIATEVQKGRERMRRYGKAAIRKKLDGGYIEQIDAILDDYDFRKRSGKQVARAESLREFVDRMIKDGREAELSIDPRLFDEARRAHYSRLSVEELRGLFDSVANLDHMGRFKQKLIDAKRKRDLREVTDAVTTQIRKAKPQDRNDKRLGPQAKRLGIQALNLVSRPDTIFVRLDRGDEIGVTYNAVKQPIDEGQAQEQQMQVAMVSRMDEIFAEHYDAKTLRGMQVEKQIVEGRQWSKTQIIALALNTGNEDNFKRLMDPNVHADSVMSPEKLDTLLRELDANDWAFIQAIWDQINTYWPQLADIHKRRTGVAPKKVEAKLMVGAPPGVRGGYYPIKYDPGLGVAAARDEATAWDRYTTAGHGSTTQVVNGMTKQRETSGGGRTLLFDLSVPFRHLRETIRYIALSEAVDNAHRVLNDPQVVEALQATGRSDTLKTLNLWLQDTAQGPIFNTDLLSTAARIARNNFTLAKLSFNMKTVVLQVTGLGQSGAVIGYHNLLYGLQAYSRSPQASIEDVTARSALMAERQTTFQKDIYDFINDTNTTTPLQNRYRKAQTVYGKSGLFAMIKTQFLTVDMPTWIGAYRDGLRRYNDNEEKAVHFADRMVLRAQGGAFYGDRSALERGTLGKNIRQADMVKFFTTLKGYLATKFDRIQIEILRAHIGLQEADSHTARAAVISWAALQLFILIFFEAIAMGLLYAVLFDEEDAEDLMGFFRNEAIGSVFGGVPILSDAVAAFRGYRGGGIYETILGSFGEAAKQVEQGENDKALRRSLGEVIGVTTGLPTTATLRLIEGVLNDDNDTSPAEMLFGTNPLTR